MSVSVDMLEKLGEALSVDLAEFLKPVDSDAMPIAMLPSGPRTKA